MLALERTPAGKVIYLNADYEPVDKAEAVLARLVRPDGSVEVLLLKPERLELTREDFHLPGQHDQQSHAGEDARNEAGAKVAAAESPSGWGQGWWYNAGNSKLVAMDPGELGPHGDHDGWIALDEHAAELGIDPEAARAATNQYGHMEGDTYVEASDEEIDRGTAAIQQLDTLVRVRYWPSNHFYSLTGAGDAKMMLRSLPAILGGIAGLHSDATVSVDGTDGSYSKIPVLEALSGNFNPRKYQHRYARAAFHLPGQHEQQDHAGGRDRSAETSGKWRERDIDHSTLNNVEHTPRQVRSLQSAFYNAEPETVDEMFGWAHLEQLQVDQRAFEEAHPGLMGVRSDVVLKGRPATVDTLHKAIDQERVFADGPAAAAWIAMHGSPMEPPSSPPPVPLGRFKRCYDNTLEFVQRNPGYKYCEGLVVDAKTKMAFQHAWATDKDGRVVDVTLGWQPKAYYHGVTFPDAAAVKRARVRSGDVPTITFKSAKWLKKELKL